MSGTDDAITHLLKIGAEPPPTKAEMRSFSAAADSDAEKVQRDAGRSNPIGAPPEGTYGYLANRITAAARLVRSTTRGAHYAEELTKGSEYRDAFLTMLRGKAEREEIEWLRAGEMRDQTTGTGSSGGFAIPAGFRADLVKSLLQGSPIRSLATVLETPTGIKLPMPVVDDTAQAASILAENTGFNTTTDPSFTSASVGAFSYVAPAVLLPWSLVEDAGIDILSALAAIAGDRIARGQDAHFATGSGTGQPVGISSATVGKTTATNATVTLAEWEAFFFSLRPAYRTNASVVMHSATYQEALSLLDSSNRPVFDREVGTMFGFRVVCDDNMAQIGANAVVAVAGRFDRGYLLRDVVPTTAVVLKERFCDVLCSAVVAAQRTDANLTDLAALRALKMHS